MAGDHTPLALSDPAVLTPLGARQMSAQGAAFRNRYLVPSRRDEFVGIAGINAKDIDHSQVHVTSSTDQYSSASALAFLQGLYPPSPHRASDLDTPPYSRLHDGSVSNYPLCGYQYPNIHTVSEADPDSIWNRGHARCTKRDISLFGFFNNGIVDSLHQESKAFYSRLWDEFFCEAFPLSQASFHNAHELYDYATYRWNHDGAVRAVMTSADMDRLRDLAWKEQALKHADVPDLGDDEDKDEDLTSAIAGRTLAARVATLFAENIESGGERNKLSLDFTSHEPFLGFFALAGLVSGVSSHLFTRLPDPGATLTFELFSIDSEEGIDGAYNSTAGVSYDTDNELREGDLKGSGGRGGGGDTARRYPSLAPCSCEEMIRPETGKGLHGETSGDELANALDEESTRPPSDRPKGSSNDDEVVPRTHRHTPRFAEPQDHAPANQASHNYDKAQLVYPPVDKLYVRCLYRNGSTGAEGGNGPPAPLVPHALFGGAHASMSFKHFNETVWKVGVADYPTWCRACESDAGFCDRVLSEGKEQRRHLLVVVLSSGATLLIVGLVLLFIGFVMT